MKKLLFFSACVFTCFSSQAQYQTGQVYSTGTGNGVIYGTNVSPNIGGNVTANAATSVSGGGVNIIGGGGNASAGASLTIGGAPSNSAGGSVNLSAGGGSSGIGSITLQTPNVNGTTGLINLIVPNGFVKIGSSTSSYPLTISGSGAITAVSLATTGNVGIGSTSPQEALQLGDRFVISNGGTKVIGYNFHYNGTNDARLVTDGVSEIRMTGGSLSFITAPSGSAGSTIGRNYGMYIDQNGYIAIGTTTTNGMLHINASNQTGWIVDNTSTGSTYGTLVNTNNNACKALAVQNTGTGVETFHVLGTGDLYMAGSMTATGAVSAGSITTTGTMQLGGNNSYSLSEFTINNTSDGNPTNTEWQYEPFMIWSGVTNSDYGLYMGVSKANKCSYIQAVNVGVAPSYLALNYRGGVVTIGNITDFTKTAGYSLAVAGNILAQEVVVKLQTNWPDYVLTEKHKIKTLPEIENYIKANGHLEDVPDEAQVKEKGINVAEMNTTLLKKVEELTLLMIEQNKRIDALEKENEVLKATK